jgi:hypothetical protein
MGGALIFLLVFLLSLFADCAPQQKRVYPPEPPETQDSQEHKKDGPSDEIVRGIHRRNHIAKRCPHGRHEDKHKEKEEQTPERKWCAVHG